MGAVPFSLEVPVTTQHRLGQGKGAEQMRVGGRSHVNVGHPGGGPRKSPSVHISRRGQRRQPDRGIMELSTCRLSGRPALQGSESKKENRSSAPF